jgi:hypothetical protein
MSDSKTTSQDSWNGHEPPSPDPLRLAQAVEQALNAHTIALMIKRIIWSVCIGLETIAIFGSMIYLFITECLACKLLCVVIALIAHEGMVVVVIWMFLTSLRMDMLKELKSMELQLAEFRMRTEIKK